MEVEKELKVTKKKSASSQITSLQVSCSDSIACLSPPQKEAFVFLNIAQSIPLCSFQEATLLGS
jgi:hypothetical protein